MIRRQDNNDWLLIDQTSHARIAGTIARAWGNADKITPLPMSKQLLPAIQQHDEGWKKWDVAPTLHPETDFPRSFMEMEMTTAVELWEQSISYSCGIRAEETRALNRQFHRFLARSGRRLTQQRSFIVDIIFSMEQPFDLDLLTQRLAAHAEGQKLNRSTLLRVLELLEAADMLKIQKRAHGSTLYQPPGRDRVRQPFAGIWVSRHFCHLAEQARESHTSDEDTHAIDTFLSQQVEVRKELEQIIVESFRSTLKQFSTKGIDDWEETGLQWVQFFDRLSLWLCCQQEIETLTIDSPRGCTLHFTPLSSGEIAIDPFPFSDEKLQLSTSTRRIPASSYASETDLHDAIAAATSEKLEWKLVKW